MSRRKDIYVWEGQKSYCLYYRLVYHTMGEMVNQPGFYGIVVEQYEISPAGEKIERSYGRTPRALVSDGSFTYGGRPPDGGLLRRVGRSEITGFSESEEEAEEFLDLLSREAVDPDSLYEVYDDWMSAFHPRWKGAGDCS